MKIRELTQLLERQDPEALVVLNDRTEDLRSGILRALTVGDIQKIELGEVQAEFGSFVCAWRDRNDETTVPIESILIGPA